MYRRLPSIDGVVKMEKEYPIKVTEISLCINSKKHKNRPPNDAYQFLRVSAYGEGKGEGSGGRCGGLWLQAYNVISLKMKRPEIHTAKRI